MKPVIDVNVLKFITILAEEILIQILLYFREGRSTPKCKHFTECVFKNREFPVQNKGSVITGSMYPPNGTIFPFD
jgi:hypothetical protein